ncbi:MAG: IS200/IS605 family transposase [Defluviitaleaceae bacterium]|nr:IS200/IS605 family transposase [Defluviitaleaceae bacterium]
MSDIKSPAITNINYQFVWHTKHKVAFLESVMRVRLRELLIQDCNARGIVVLSGGNIGNSYVHIKLLCPPNFSPSDIMKQLKGRSSRLLQIEFPSLKNKGIGGSIWNSGYFCASFGAETHNDLQAYLNG